MNYKVVLVHEKTNCCNSTPIAGEIEKECNRWGSSGYVLVTAYRQQAAAGQRCNSQNEVGAVLIFAKRD
jgi:hypothetical protein